MSWRRSSTGAFGSCRLAVVVFCFSAIACSQRESSPSTPPPAKTIERVTAALNANPQTADFVVEAQNSIRIQTGGAVVNGGDVGARGTGSGPFLSGGVAIDLLTGVQVQTTRNVIADSVRLGTGVVTGDVQTNHFTGGTGGSHGTVTALVALPALPAASAVTPGTANLTVATGATVTASAFAFATVAIGTGSTLRLPAGTYQIRDVTMSAGARLEAMGSVQIRISNRLAGTSGAFIGPRTGVTLTAKDIRIEVSGINGTDGSLGATPKAVAFTSGGTVTALMLVPNGTLQLGTGMVARGAFMAKDVDAGGAGAQILYQDGFANACTAQSCNDNNPCTNDVCGTSGCTHTNVTNGTTCSDGNACTSGETCQAGACTGGAAVTCSADQCHTVGVCVPATGCPAPVNKANGTACNDGNACTTGETCQAGSCGSGSAVTCTADQCHTVGACVPANGCPAAVNKANGTACNDGNACTQTDTCQAGACAGANAVTCVAQDQCHVAGTCNTSTGACSNPIATNGTSCNDGNACTHTDRCQAGACTGANPVTCVAQDQCHIAGTCNPGTGVCSNPVASNGTSCSDGNSCTAADTCQSGNCVGGSSTCGTLALANTSIFTSSSLNFTTAVVSDLPAVTPGDRIHVSATITDTGISLSLFGDLDVQNTSGSTVVLPGFEESVEYFSPAQNAWVPLATAEYDNTGQQAPSPPPLLQASLTVFVRTFGVPGVTYSFFPPIVGTSIDPGATGGWTYTSFVSFPVAAASVLLDPQQASAVRSVIRFNPIGPSTVRDEGVLDLTSLFAALSVPPVTGMVVTANLDQGAASAPLATTSSGLLSPGSSALFTGELVAPALDSRDQYPSDESYVDYLSSNSTKQHHMGVNVVAGTTSTSGDLFLPSAVPLVNVDVTGPSDLLAGQSTQYALALRNDGTGVAGPFMVTDTVDGLPLQTQVSTPSAVAPGETGAGTVSFDVPSSRPAGPLSDQVAVTWNDRNGNVYGPLTKTFAPNIHVHAQGSLTLSATVPQLTGTEVLVTLTALDQLDAPVAGLPVHVVVTGPNARVLDVTTGPNGTAPITYAGSAIGVDTLIASATVVAATITSTPAHVTWATAVGTPCTGRANPLDVVLVIDGSPSMFNGTNVGAAEVATDSFIDDLDFSRDQVAAVLFSGDAQLYAPLTTDPALAKTEVNTALEGFAHACDGFCQGGSNFALALDTALAEFQGPRHRDTASPLLVFISDGGNTGVDFTPEVAQLSASGIRVVTIGLGADVDSLVMRQIASSTNDYFYSPTSSELEWVYNNVNQDICRNQPPIVSAGGNQGLYGVRLPQLLTLAGEVHDDGPTGDSRVTNEWTQVSGPAPVNFVDATSPQTQVLFTDPGVYVLRLTATDGFLTVADQATVTVDPAPSLAGAALTLSLPTPGPFTLGTTASVRAVLKDSSGVAISDFVISFSTSGVNVAAGTATTDSTGIAIFAYAGSKVGTDRIDAMALGGTATLPASPLFALWQSMPTGPAQVTQGWIGSPIHQSTVSGSVPITLAAGVTLTSGTVTYWPMNHPDDVHTLAATAHGSPGDTLATLDTTLLANGPYVVQVLGTDSSGATQVNLLAVTVSGDYKPGRLVVQIDEFKIPLPGLSLEIGRKYDSLEREKVGDFGHGWSLTVGHPDLETDPAHNVTLTEPGGRRVTFGFTAASFPSFFSFLFGPRYVPEAGVFGSLTSDGCALLVVNGGRIVCFEDQDLVYAPTTYTYTDPYGRAYTMAASGELRSIKDLQGNTLTFSANGITSSSGSVAVQFDRDAAGRITRIAALPADGSTQDQYFYEYDAAGDLTVVTRPGESPIVRHSYDGDHLLTRTIDGRGNPARVSTFDGEGRLSTDTDAMGNLTTYAYDVPGHATHVTNPDTGVVVQTFDDRGLLLSEADPLGRTTSHAYDADRNETSRTNALGEITHFTYDANGNQTSVTNARGEVSQTTFNQFGQPLTATDAMGNATSLTYDDRFIPLSFSDSLGTLATFTSSERGLPLTVTDADGQISYFAYDASGNVTSKTDRLGRRTTNSYDGIGRLLTVRDPQGAVTSYGYDPRGTREATVEALGEWTRYRYDGNDNLILEFRPFDPRSTAYVYDAANHLVQVQAADGFPVVYTRDFRGNKLTEANELNRVTTYTYDLAGELTKTTYPDGTFATRSYDSLGRLASTTDERGDTTLYEYEAGCGCADRLTKVTDPVGRFTTTAYDADGRRTSVIDPAGHMTQYFYDARSRLVETLYPDGTSEADGYDILGRMVSHTDQAGAVTSYGYDVEGELTSVTDALGDVTSYSYDDAGNLATIADANGHTTTFEYDLMRRKTKRTLPLGQSEMFGYDYVGNLSSHVDFAGKTTTMTYDLRDRLLSRTPDPSLAEPTESYAYNPTGTRASMTDASGTTTYLYDLRDRVQTKAAPAGTLTYTFDASGNVATIRSSNANGTSVDYAWNAANELISVTDNRIAGGLTTTAYGVTGRPSRMATQPGGVTATYVYDSMNRITSLNWQKGTSLATWSSTYNARGQRLTSTELSGRQVAYGYDAVARLTRETVGSNPPAAGSNGDIQDTLDATGNRVSRVSSLSTIASAQYSYDANDQLTAEVYDLNGNTISSQGATFAYDFRNRLKNKNGGIVALTYDCDGARVAKTVGGVTTKYLVDDLNPTGYSQVLEEISSGAVQVRYTYGTMLVSQTRRLDQMPQSSFYGFDDHGNVTFLTDDSGVITDSYSYDAWGSMIAHTGMTANTRLYSGEELDPDVGLIDLRARQYNPTFGRFVEGDPHSGHIESPRSLNRYVFSNGDPVNLSDPTGADVAIVYPLLVAAGVGIAAEALNLYVKSVKAETLQNDFPPFTFQKDTDPGRNNKCFRAALAGVIRCNKLFPAGNYRKICIAGSQLLAILCQASDIFNHFPGL